jgi:agmatine deiminase
MIRNNSLFICLFKRVLAFNLLFYSTLLSFGQGVEEQFKFPAEFEKIDGIWLGWGITTYTDSGSDKDLEDIHLQMIQALTPYVLIHLIVKDLNQQNDVVKKLLRIGVDTTKIKYFYSPNWHFWLRDYGPVFMQGNRGHLSGIDFRFNCYGECLPSNEYARIVDKGDGGGMHCLTQQQPSMINNPGD